MKRLFAIPCTFCVFAALACAEDLPGIAPPDSQLYYPTGVALLRGSPDTLVVCNTNFDQRYNAGTMMTLDVNALIDAIPVGLFQDDIHVVPNSVRKIYNFCGEVFPVSTGNAGEYRVYSALRGKNRLLMMEANNGVLNCATGSNAVLGTDCSPAYTIRTLYGDPFAIAYASLPARFDLLAVGHLLTQQDGSGGVLSTSIALADPSLFDARIEAERRGENPDENMMDSATVQKIADSSGTNALVFVPPATMGNTLGGFISGGRRVGVTTPTFNSMILYRIREDKTLDDTITLAVHDEGGIDEVRGIALAPNAPRAYITARFQGAGGTTSSGIGVVEINSLSLRLLSVTEAGEELGTPSLIERTVNGRLFRTLYAPDIKDDTIWVIDVSTDLPQVIGQIKGRADGDLLADEMHPHTLDAPTKIVFYERPPMTYGFVTNFANSTISVFDASDPIRPATAVLTRFGHALTPDGKDEGTP